ncbi:DUF1874 domain-containing protein [Hydrogenophaga sp. NH-16]|uniref:STIV orfB116 family protein n=1 Tax=Hydrogenophaga sp. NH-16 TaxID=2184519 RepID=UPI000FDB0A8E|nr:DUF1874 domain-containing protein [Hydrogenophaga sp. NH-16]
MTDRSSPAPSIIRALHSRPVALLNAAVMTADGMYALREIPLGEARLLVRTHGFVSAIGHEATANVVSRLLQIDCPMNRHFFKQDAGQIALVFRLKQRLPEGFIVRSEEELEALGYSFARLKRMC